ncbi:MAG: 4-hydroxythreonine-4-phosphate dehydrogenase PdxA [Pseudomonadota bacterium]
MSPCQRILITPGEPAGIGPDIVAMVAHNDWDAELIAVADPSLLQSRAAMLKLPLTLRELDLADAPMPHRAGTLPVIPVTMGATSRPGVLTPDNAPYVMQTLERSVELCQQGVTAALVTAPVQKSIINEAGIAFTGHTEFLAEKTRCYRVVMMLATPGMRVALVTTHLPLADVSRAITRPVLHETLTIMASELRARFALNRPRIAVLGLNPHAGESGHLGREEIETIVPVLDELRAGGMQLLGPLPADTAFNPKVLDQCDAVLAMYHDQGLPALKQASFGKAVNITLGLPFVRTSVDHGTALDLAGSGDADCSSLKAALLQAITMTLPAP